MKRLHLSLIALIGSILLFIVASFAWFTYAGYADIDWFNSSVAGYDVELELYESEDDITYEIVDDISFDNLSPGDTVYYLMNITNQQEQEVLAEVFLIGFINTMSDGSEYTSDYSLIEAIFITTYLEEDLKINNQLLSDLLISAPDYESAQLSIVGIFTIAGLETKTINFNLTIATNIGNEYQNLGFDVDNIYIALDSADGS
ncbi:MAG: hypothetical protein ACOCUD_01340 [Bacillota bacterium]